VGEHEPWTEGPCKARRSQAADWARVVESKRWSENQKHPKKFITSFLGSLRRKGSQRAPSPSPDAGARPLSDSDANVCNLTWRLLPRAGHGHETHKALIISWNVPAPSHPKLSFDLPVQLYCSIVRVTDSERPWPQAPSRLRHHHSSHQVTWAPGSKSSLNYTKQFCELLYGKIAWLAGFTFGDIHRNPFVGFLSAGLQKYPQKGNVVTLPNVLCIY
jgi:hypothetical protein